MKKKIFLSIVTIFFITSFAFAAWEHEPTINPNQPLSPGDWIYRVAFSNGKTGWEHLIIIYKGIEEEKVVVECIIDVAYETRSMTETREFKLPLNSNNQAFLNKANTKSTLMLTVIDGHNRLKVEETEYRDDVPLTRETNIKIRDILESKIKEDLSRSGYWINRRQEPQTAGPSPEKK